MLRAAAILAVLFALAPGVAFPQSNGTFDPAAIVRQRFDALGTSIPGPAPVLILTDREQDDGLVSDGRITLSYASIRAARSRQELDGLLAFLITQAAPQSGFTDNNSAQPLTSILAAGAVIAAGERIDRIDEANAPPESQRDYSWSPRVPSQPAGTERGRAALALMQRARTCSGAALTLMTRLASPRDLINGPPIRFLAQRARQQFGSLAAPPDTTCIPSN